jgi:Putative S-adenosyl-L-methionine-dependent methyltransferase
MLRAGGYFAWAAQPVYKHEEAQQKVWKGNFSDFQLNKLAQLLLSEDYELV